MSTKYCQNISIDNVRSTDWYTSTNQDGEVVDLPLSAFNEQLVKTALSLSSLLNSIDGKPIPPYMGV